MLFNTPLTVHKHKNTHVHALMLSPLLLKLSSLVTVGNCFGVASLQRKVDECELQSVCISSNGSKSHSGSSGPSSVKVS